MSDEAIYINLAILGFSADDHSSEAEMARTWVMATLDEDEEWFETRSRESIRLAYQSWRRIL
jgi:hypothetical protein